MITIQGDGLNAGLNRRRRGFLRRISLKNVAKAAFAPHTLINKKYHGKIIKGIFAPHALLIKKKKK